ncbi:RnfABCDGE type electron transport complex subunit D [bacterium]|nr:RnfABCDGE type electron transport complex subunit D [bacterium]
MADKYYVSSSPHISSGVSTKTVMWSVVLALIPALLGSIYFFGMRALWLTLLGVAGAVVSEAVVELLSKKPLTIGDGSAVITGILLAFNIPPGVPWWMPVVGASFGIIFGKMVFGGLGNNPLNPALVGRAFLMASWPVEMTTKWIAPRGGSIPAIATKIDAITGATPLGVLKNFVGKTLADPNASPEKIAQAKQVLHSMYANWTNLFFGNVGGVIGETSAVLLIVGFVYLLVRKFVDWRIPLSFIGTAAILGWIFGSPEGMFKMNVLFYIFSGGLMLGALFMATDMVTSPITVKGRWIFGIGCGILTAVIRRWGGYPEGVSYSILLMNLAVPIINRHSMPKKFGYKK